MLIWHYIKGRANVINYHVRCKHCLKRTRSRKHGADAVKEWESMNMKQTNLEWLRSLHPDETVAKFERKCADLRRDYNPYDAASIVLEWLAFEHVEPIVLTPEERKAAQLCVEIGLPWIFKNISAVWLSDHKGCGMIRAITLPNISMGLIDAKWIPDAALDLRTLLKETI